MEPVRSAGDKAFALGWKKRYHRNGYVVIDTIEIKE